MPFPRFPAEFSSDITSQNTLREPTFSDLAKKLSGNYLTNPSFCGILYRYTACGLFFRAAPTGEKTMPRFFVSSADLEEENGTTRIVLEGPDAAHISRALRMKPGEELVLCDERGTEYRARIESAGGQVVCTVLDSAPSETEPPYEAVVYQALAKGDRFDTVLMKATELGACRIVPVLTARCTVKPDPKDLPKKRERWQRIAAEAAGQCGRGRIPKVALPMSFADAVREAARADLPLFCYEGGGDVKTILLPRLFEGIDTPKTVSVFIGPEGGFEPFEAELARIMGLKICSMGPRILRCETAPVAALSAVMYATGNM